MNRSNLQRIINLKPNKQQLKARIQNLAQKANQDSTPSINPIAASTNTNHSSQHTITQIKHIQLFKSSLLTIKLIINNLPHKCSHTS